jgi:hypothetical protein
MRSKGAIAWLVVGALGALLVALWAGAAYRERPSPIPTPAATAPVVTSPAASTTAPATGLSIAGLPTGTVQAALVLQMQGSPGTGSRVTVRARSGTGKILFSQGIPAGATGQIATNGSVWLTLDASTGVGLNVNGRPVEIPGGISQLVIAPNGTVRGS